MIPSENTGMTRSEYIEKTGSGSADKMRSESDNIDKNESGGTDMTQTDNKNGLSMDEKNLNTRMETLENKLDLVLNYVNRQRLNSEVYEDLLSDLSLIGKDVYNTSVVELEKQQVEINPEEYKQLVINLLKSIRYFNRTLELLNTMTEQEEIPQYSLWKALREMNNPQMKTSLGFMITFAKKLSRINNSENKQ